MIRGIGNVPCSTYSQTKGFVGEPLKHVITPRGQILVSRTDGDVPWSPRVHSKRPRVCRHHAHMLKHMCAWCRCTRGRFGRTHGGFSACDTTHTPHHNTHHTTTQDTTPTTRFLFVLSFLSFVSCSLSSAVPWHLLHIHLHGRFSGIVSGVFCLSGSGCLLCRFLFRRRTLKKADNDRHTVETIRHSR